MLVWWVTICALVVVGRRESLLEKTARWQHFPPTQNSAWGLLRPIRQTWGSSSPKWQPYNHSVNVNLSSRWSEEAHDAVNDSSRKETDGRKWSEETDGQCTEVATTASHTLSQPDFNLRLTLLGNPLNVQIQRIFPTSLKKVACQKKSPTHFICVR